MRTKKSYFFKITFAVVGIVLLAVTALSIYFLFFDTSIDLPTDEDVTRIEIRTIVESEEVYTRSTSVKSDINAIISALSVAKRTGNRFFDSRAMIESPLLQTYLRIDFYSLHNDDEVLRVNMFLYILDDNDYILVPYDAVYRISREDSNKLRQLQ